MFSPKCTGLYSRLGSCGFFHSPDFLCVSISSKISLPLFLAHCLLSLRYKKPECAVRSPVTDMEDPFRDRDLNGEERTAHILSDCSLETNCVKQTIFSLHSCELISTLCLFMHTNIIWETVMGLEVPCVATSRWSFF